MSRDYYRDSRSDVQYVVPCSRKSKTVALVLCAFGGFFGLHQFYAGKTGKGILYLLTLGVFGIMWVVDFFRILFNAFEDSRGLPIINKGRKHGGSRNNGVALGWKICLWLILICTGIGVMKTVGGAIFGPGKGTVMTYEEYALKKEEEGSEENNEVYPDRLVDDNGLTDEDAEAPDDALQPEDTEQTDESVYETVKTETSATTASTQTTIDITTTKTTTATTKTTITTTTTISTTTTTKTTNTSSEEITSSKSQKTTVPYQESEQNKIIYSAESDKYHLSCNCYAALTIKVENRRFLDNNAESIQWLENHGYTPCKKCAS